MSVTAAQLVAEVKTTGVDQAQSNLASVGKAADTLGQKLSSMKPLDASKSISNVDAARAKLTLIESDVTKAKEKLETLKNAANAGEAVTGIPEAEAKLTLLEEKAQKARASLQKMEDQEKQTAQSTVQVSQAMLDAGEKVSGSEERMSKETNAFSSSVQRARETAQSAFSGIASSAEQAFTQVEESADMASEAVGRSSGKGLIGSIGKFAGGLVDAVSQAGHFINGLQMIGQTALNVSRYLLEGNASMEQTQVAFTGLLGSAQKASAFLADMTEFAKNTPFDLPGVLDASRRLLAFGFTAEQVKPTLTAVGDAASGLGAGQDGINRITLALGQMHARSKISAADMLQLTEVGVPGWQILADKMGLTVGQVMKLSEQGELLADDTLPLLIQGMEDSFGGQMAGQAKTFSGIMERLGDTWEQIKRKAMAPIFDIAKNSLSRLADVVSSPAFEHFVVVIGQGIANALTWMGNVIGKLYDRIAPVVKAIIDWAQKNHVLEIAMKLLQDRIEFALIPLRVLWNIITFLIDKFKQWEEKYHFVEKATKLVTDVLTKLHDIIEKVKEKVQNQIEWFAKWVDSFHLVQHVSEALDFIVGKLHDIIHALKEKIKEAIDRFQTWEEKHHIVQRASEALHNVMQKLHDLLERLRDKIKEIIDRFQSWVERHHLVQKASEALHDILSKLHDLVHKLIDKVQDGITSFHNWELSHHAVQRAVDLLHEGLSKLRDLIHNIKERVQEYIEKAKDWIDKHHIVQQASDDLHKGLDKLHDMIDKLGGKVGEAAGKFKDWMDKHHVLQLAADGLREAINRVHDAIHNIKERVKEAITQFIEWNRQHNILKTTSDNLRVVLKNLHDVIKNVIDRAKDIASKIKDWDDKTKPLNNTLQTLQGIAAKVERWLRALALAAAAVFAPFDQIWKTFVNNLLPAWNDFLKAVGPFKKSLGDLYVALAPLLKIIGEIALAIGLLDFADLLATIRGFANGLANSIGFIIQVLTGLVEFWTGLATTITGIVKLIVDFVTGHWDKLGKDLEQTWKGIQLMAKGVWDVISGTIGGVITFIIGLISGFIGGIIDFFKHLYDVLVGHSIVPDLVNELRSWFQRGWDWITNIFKGIGQWFSDRFNEIINGIAGFPGRVRDIAQDAWNKITGAWNGLSGWVHDHVWQPMADGLGNALSGVGDTVTGAFNNVSGAIKWSINGVIDSVNSAITNVNGMSSKIGVPAIPLIPHLAKGTNFFAGGMAVVGEIGPELVMLPRGAQVVPNNQIGSYLPAGAQISPQSSQQVVHVHVTVQPNDLVVDGRRMTTALMPHVAQQIRLVTGQK